VACRGVLRALTLTPDLFLATRVRTKTVKKSAKSIIEKYYPRLTNDFQLNKRICHEVAVIPSKRLRNRIAGYLTHLMKRIEKGPVRGISFKLQEEEREKRDNYVPDISQVNTTRVEIDADTKAMLESIHFSNLPGVEVVENKQRFDRRRRDRDQR